MRTSFCSLAASVAFIASTSASSAQPPSFPVGERFANPTVLDVQHPKPEERIEARYPVDCWMLVVSDDPIAQFDVESPTPLSMWIHGAESARALVLSRDGKLEHCVPHERTGAHELASTFAPGKWEIRLAYSAGERNLPKRVRITVADQARANTYSQLDRVERVTLSPSHKQPVVFDVTSSTARIFGGAHCQRGLSFAREPDVLLIVDKPLEQLELGLTDPSAGLYVQGPLESAPFMWPACDRVATSWKAPGVRKGTYALFIGARHDLGAQPLRVLASHRGTVRDPLFLLPVAEGLEVARRVVTAYLPFLPERGLELATAESRQHLADLFLAAPAGLLVYAADDFVRGIDAPHFFPRDQGIVVDGVLAQGVKEIPPEAFPRRGEPLLLLDGGADRSWVVATAEGLRFSTSPGQLATTPGGPTSLPSKPRVVIVPLNLDELTKLAPPDAAKLVEPYSKAVARFDACVERTFGAYGPDAADNGVYRVRFDGTHFSYDEISDEIFDRAYRNCGTETVEKAFQAAWNALAKRTFQAAAARLDTIRRRFDTPR